MMKSGTNEHAYGMPGAGPFAGLLWIVCKWAGDLEEEGEPSAIPRRRVTIWFAGLRSKIHG